MRWSSLAGCCSLLLASQMLVACGDDDPVTPGGIAGSSVGGSSAGKSSTAGTDTGGSDEGGKGGTFGTAGTETGGTAGTDAGGTAGTGGTPATECTTTVNCVGDDSNPCTDNKCVDGKCVNVPNDENECDDGNDCTNDKCEAGECVKTNNTGTCNDNNECTSQDKCADGVCKGTNNTADCNDLSTCTTGDKCAAGVCTGTRNTTTCPVCVGADNMIKNCDFSDGLTSWAPNIEFDGGQAMQNAVNERDVLDITAGGNFIYSVQPRQEPLALKQGYKYKFGMVAGSSFARDGVVALTQAAGTYQVYSTGNHPGGGFAMALEEQMKPFAFEFFMTKPDDANVKLEIKFGNTDPTMPMPANTTYFDDVFVKEIKCAAPADCNDGNECTTDTCDAATGKCTWTNNALDCADDGESCTSDKCVAGECTHPPIADGETCANEATDTANCTKNECTAGKCEHPWAGTCACTTNAQCNDADPCTTDTCNVAGGGVCAYAPSTAACDDGVVCTATDTCNNLVCGGTDVCFAGCATNNLLMTCDFATADTAPWQTYAANGGAVALSVVDGRLNARVTKISANDYDLQLLQAGFNFEKSKTYKVKLNVLSSVARKIFIGVTHNGGGYETLKGETYDITPEMKAIEFDIVTDTLYVPPTEGYKLEIRLSNPANNPNPFVAHTLQFDNVSIAAVTP
jgi:hypothetical protein